VKFYRKPCVIMHFSHGTTITDAAYLQIFNIEIERMCLSNLSGMKLCEL